MLTPVAGFRSVTPAACREAQDQGMTLYALDSANDGGDDPLIAKATETQADIIQAIFDHH